MEVQVRIPVVGGYDMKSIMGATAATVLPAGFAEYFTDLTGAADHSFSFTAGLTAASCASVTTESGGKRRLTTQTHVGGGAAEILPYYDQLSTAQQLPTMTAPKSSAWYVEGRAAIETHAATSALFPCSIAYTLGGVMLPTTITSNTFVALGLVGSSYAGGSNSFLSFAASSAGTMTLQTTTIAYTSVPHSYGLSFDGAGTISAWVDGAVQWTTTNLSSIYSAADGFHPNQWVFCTDNTATTMLCDYLYGAGPRI